MVVHVTIPKLTYFQYVVLAHVHPRNGRTIDEIREPIKELELRSDRDWVARSLRSLESKKLVVLRNGLYYRVSEAADKQLGFLTFFTSSVIRQFSEV